MSVGRIHATWVEIRYVNTQGRSFNLALYTDNRLRCRSSFHDQTRITHLDTQIRDGRHVAIHMGHPVMRAHVYVGRGSWNQGRIESVGEGVILAGGPGFIDQEHSTGVFLFDCFGVPKWTEDRDI
jgi:hypothetical protein